MTKSFLIRAAGLLWLASLAACHGSSSGPQTVGVGIGVALTAPSGTTLVAAGDTLEIDATVSNDPNNAGVTWTLTGAGSIASSDTTKAIYQAPSNVVGSLFGTLTATSVTDPTKYASVTITVNGTPTIMQPVLFPANQNVAYTTYVTAAGGTAPYTWTVSAGALPAGLSLSGSTTAATAITGTPTTLGTSTFTLTLTDAVGLTASLPMTLTVSPQTACLLNGQFTYLQTGFYQGKPVTRAGSINVTVTGTVTGVHDYKDATNARPAAAVTSGTCVTLTQNRGQLHISSSASGNESFDFATNASLAVGHLQQDDGTGVVEAGEFFKQDPTAFTLVALKGDWAFGAVGDDGAGNRLAVAGRATLDANGLVSAGVGDNNGASPVVGGIVAGTFTAPDANGRGTAALTLGGQPLPIAFYVVDQNTLLIVSSDSQSSAPRVAGRMTRQTGAGALDSTAFAGPAVLSMWGSTPVNGVAETTATTGRLFDAAATAGSAAGTASVALDIVDRGAQLISQGYTTQPYTVASNGRGTLAVGSGATLRNFVLYADGTGGGYAIEPASVTGNFGILDAQAAGPYSDFATAYYEGGTMFPGSTSPITLAPQLLFQTGAINGNLTGNYALDPATGRMVAAVSRTILGGSDLVIYIVNPAKLVIIGDGLNISNSQLAWFEAY
ncbi:MAG TPA: putative Ig domain-containing protein [Steroidobacteraceae bacterium]|nr:putative Ig domain-containing protein [Steroidobacteraceae bacterium]